MLGTITTDEIERNLKDNKSFVSVLLLTIGTSIVWALNSDMLINTLVLGMSALAMFMILQIKLNLGGGLVDFVSKNSFPIYIIH